MCVYMFICVELTLPTTLAEFLTKVLCHHTRAGAITRVLRVVTRMIIVHLIGWVVCKTNRKGNENNSFWTKTFHYGSKNVWLLHTYFWITFQKLHSQRAVLQTFYNKVRLICIINKHQSPIINIQCRIINETYSIKGGIYLPFNCYKLTLL